jgi:hypothetical protein
MNKQIHKVFCEEIKPLAFPYIWFLVIALLLCGAGSLVLELANLHYTQRKFELCMKYERTVDKCMAATRKN